MSSSLYSTLIPVIAAERNQQVETQTRLNINLDFTPAFDTNFGANATAARKACIAAAQKFAAHFADKININITVDAEPGTNTFGHSDSTTWYIISYDDLRDRLVDDAKTANDNLAVSAEGSMTASDPTGGAGSWWVTRAQAKAIKLIPDDFEKDGKVTFGAGNQFTFSGIIVANTYDVCVHAAAESDGMSVGIGFLALAA